MRKVKSIIARASEVRHSQQPPGSRGPDGLVLPETVDGGTPTLALPSETSITESGMHCRGHASAPLIGEAGANLVLSRLQSWGIAAQSAMPSLPYDLIADIPGFDLLRIQVKTRSRPRGGHCRFRMQRGFYRSKSGTFPYRPDDFDIAALCCLSLNAVFFHAGLIDPISVRSSLLRLPGLDRETLELSIERIKRSRLKDKQASLASIPSGIATTITASPAADASPTASAAPEQAEFDFEFRS